MCQQILFDNTMASVPCLHCAICTLATATSVNSTWGRLPSSSSILLQSCKRFLSKKSDYFLRFPEGFEPFRAEGCFLRLFVSKCANWRCLVDRNWSVPRQERQSDHTLHTYTARNLFVAVRSDQQTAWKPVCWVCRHRFPCSVKAVQFYSEPVTQAETQPGWCRWSESKSTFITSYNFKLLCIRPHGSRQIDCQNLLKALLVAISGLLSDVQAYTVWWTPFTAGICAQTLQLVVLYEVHVWLISVIACCTISTMGGLPPNSNGKGSWRLWGVMQVTEEELRPCLSRTSSWVRRYKKGLAWSLQG